jgi:hypothetical protein
MRHALPALLILAATGCATQSPELLLRAELTARTAGVVLHDDGLSGAAAMADQVCLFDALAGEVTGDLELDGGQERLLDAWGTHALAATDTAVWQISREIEGTPEKLQQLHAIDGRLITDGVALLHSYEGRCAVTFEGSGDSVSMVTQLDCSGTVGFSADRTSGTVFIADGSDVIALDRTGTFTAFQGANVNRITWNPVAQNLVGARVGESMLHAWTVKGEALWQVALSGPLHDLDIAGDKGFVAVMASSDTGAEFRMLDGTTGGSLVEWPTPSLAEVSVSADGDGLALITEDIVYLYDVIASPSAFGLPSAEQAAALQPLIGADGMVSTGTAAGAGAGIVGTAALVALIAD